MNELEFNCDGGYHTFDLYETRLCPTCGLPSECFEDDECLTCSKQWADGLLPVNAESPEDRQTIREVTRLKNPRTLGCSVEDCHNRGERHHIDYSKPNEIVWLCMRHHTDTHMLLKRLKPL